MIIEKNGIISSFIICLLVVMFTGKEVYAAPPPNDNFASPTSISGLSGTVAGTNVEASLETDEDVPTLTAGNAIDSVWFSWTAPADGWVRFDTIGSGLQDTVLAVYTGSDVTNLFEVASADDGSDSQSIVVFDAANGTDYMIAVYGNDQHPTPNGTITLNWEPLVEISGTIGYPNSEQFTQSLIIEVLATNNTDVTLREFITIPANTNSVPFSFLVSVGGNDLILKAASEYTDSFLPADYYKDGVWYYNSGGSKGLEANAETIDRSTSQTGLNFPLLKGNIVDGDLSLPNADTFSSGGVLGITVSRPGSETNDVLSAFSYASGENAVAYSVVVAPDSTDYRLGYIWPGSYAPYAQPGYYSSGGTVLDPNGADLFTNTGAYTRNWEIAELAAGDLNGDGTVDLTDAILGLQILTGQDPAQDVFRGADVNDDGDLGIGDVLYILNIQLAP